MLSLVVALAPTVAPVGPVDELRPPVRFTAAGEPISTGGCIGHSGPDLFDLDGDGKAELLVGDFSGHVHVYPNVGTPTAPAWGAGTNLEVKGKPIRISNW